MGKRDILLHVLRLLLVSLHVFKLALVPTHPSYVIDHQVQKLRICAAIIFGGFTICPGHTWGSILKWFELDCFPITNRGHGLIHDIGAICAVGRALLCNEVYDVQLKTEPADGIYTHIIVECTLIICIIWGVFFIARLLAIERTTSLLHSDRYHRPFCSPPVSC